MEIIKTKLLTPSQEEQIDKLWNEEYPVKLLNRFKLLLDGVENYHHYIIEHAEKNIIGWAVDFEKENETRFSVIVQSAYKGKGLGRLLMDRLKSESKEFYGWVIDHNRDMKQNGEVYQTPLPFYLKLGFEVLSEIRIESEMISAVKIKWKA